MRSRLLLVLAGVLWLLTGCTAPPADLYSKPASGESAYDSRPQKTPQPIAPPTWLPQAGDESSTVSAASPTATPASTAPTMSPSPTPTQPSAANSPTPTATPAQAAPTRLIIPAINLDVPVIEMGWSVVEKDGQSVSEWDVPEWRAAGWLKTSALIGAIGNTVLEGHQDIDGRVFEDLEQLAAGDSLKVQTESFTRAYVIVLRTIVPEKDQPLAVRQENARWIGPSNDERLTLITCWPRNGNTHRLILVALPAS
jgi:sortase A